MGAADGAGAVSSGSERPPELSPAKVAVVIGREADGCDEAFLAAATQKVYFPLRGFTSSLNLSVATALVLSRVFDWYPHFVGDLDENELRDLREERGRASRPLPPRAHSGRLARRAGDGRSTTRTPPRRASPAGRGRRGRSRRPSARRRRAHGGVLWFTDSRRRGLRARLPCARQRSPFCWQDVRRSPLAAGQNSKMARCRSFSLGQPKSPAERKTARPQSGLADQLERKLRLRLREAVDSSTKLQLTALDLSRDSTACHLLLEF